jgi:putative ABC transport system permease protein
MKLLPLIWKNVLRKKTRTLLTMGSILLPLLAICFMGTFLHALDSPDKEGTQGMFRLVTRHRVSLATLFPRAYQQQIAGLDGVEAVTNFNFFGGKYKDGGARNTFVRFAVEPGNLLKVYDDLELLSGSTADWLSDRTGCIVGMNIAKNFGWKVGDRSARGHSPSISSSRCAGSTVCREGRPRRWSSIAATSTRSSRGSRGRSSWCG